MRNIRVAGALRRREKGAGDFSMAARDWFWIVILGIGWGSTFYFNEVLLRELGPVTVSAGRVGVAALATWAFVIATGRRAAYPGRTMVDFGVHGMLMYGIPFAIYPVGQQVITAGAAGIINAMTPIMIVIVSHFWPGGERATWSKSLGVAAGFFGILLLTVPAMQGQGSSDLSGLLFVLLAPLSYGLAMNYVRRLRGTDPVAMLAWSLTFATLGIGTVALLREGLPGGIGGETLFALLFLGMVLTSLSFIIFYWLLPRVGATSISTVTFIAPVSAVFLGVALLGETVDGWKIGGMAAIFVGLLMIDGRLFRWIGRVPGPKDQPGG